MSEKFSELINNMARYHEIPSAQWESISEHIVRRDIAAGDYFLKANTLATEFGYVEKGLFRSFYRDQNGDEFIRNFSSEGQLLGSTVSLLTGEPSEVCIQAIEASTILVIDYQIFQAYFERHRCWETASRLITQHNFLQTENKAHHLLVYNAAERYELFLKQHSEIARRIHQYMIAMYLGISPVSLSRIINSRLKPAKP